MPTTSNPSSIPKRHSKHMTPSLQTSNMNSSRQTSAGQTSKTNLTPLAPSSPSISLPLHQNNEGEDDEEERHAIESLDNFYDTDNESAQEEEPSYLQQPPLVATADFFEVFGNIPDIDEISEDISISIMTPKSQMEEAANLDILSSPHSKLSATVEATQSMLEDVATSHNESTNMSEETFDIYEEYEGLDFPDEILEDDVALDKVVDADEAFEKFLELETTKRIERDEEFDWVALAKMEELRHIQQSTLTFVNELIRKVVESVEFMTPEALLRQNLDKRKLMLELKKICQDRYEEKSIGNFLNHKIIDFYKRKKTFRPILPDSLKSVELEKRKYMCAIQRLDRLLAQESHAMELSAKMLEDLETELNDAKHRVQSEVQQFEMMVKTHLLKDNRPKCNAFIERTLLQMSKCRQDVSEARFDYLMKQHTQAALLGELGQIEDLGNGLTMEQFGTLQNETQILGKKIEERNCDLNKIRIRMRNDIHLIAHYKEKEKMLKSSIAAQRMALEELIDDSRRWRNKIHDLKIERRRIRKEINEQSFQGGLLDKPALMWDYDRTCEMLEERRDLNHYLRGVLQTLQMKIRDKLKQCSSLTLSSMMSQDVLY